jgi:hypothetical protein
MGARISLDVMEKRRSEIEPRLRRPTRSLVAVPAELSRLLLYIYKRNTT